MDIFAVYVVVMFLMAIYLSRKTDRKFLGFVLIFWILTQPVLQAKFIIDIPGFPFDFQPNRLLFLILLSYLIIMKLLGVKDMQSQSGHVKRPIFEKLYYAYFIIVTASLVYNYEYIELNNLVVIPLAILTFILSYHVVRKHMTKRLFDKILYAIVLLSIVCALITIVQVGINSDFFKTDDGRIAFGKVVRATGIFRSEYALGSFQILSIFIVVTRLRSIFWRYLIILLLVLSVIFTFHRLDVLILLTCFIAYNLLLGSATTRVMSTVTLVLVVVISGAAYFIFESIVSDSDFASERLSDATIKGRFHQYGVLIKAMPKSLLFGLGGYQSKTYADLMIKNHHTYSVNAGTSKWRRVPHEIHSGYLEVGVYHGVIALSIFVTMMYQMLMYFKRRLSREFPSSFIPFVAVLIWILSNVSNGLSSFSIYNVLLLSIITGSFVSIYNYKDKR